jgi:hypothetical protein
MCKHNEYNPAILKFITPELFEGEETIRNIQIKSFIENPAVQSNLFCKDGIQRNDMPHISLPNGVEILSNFRGANSEYCKSTGKPFDRAEYLRYMLDRFKEAYGDTDTAVKAFKVFVQNFTGTGNTFGMLTKIPLQKEAETKDYKEAMSYGALVSSAVQDCRSQSTMRMDKGFNIDLNITACISGEKIKQFNENNKRSSEIIPFSEDTIFGITISSHIPAVRNDAMDQRGQNGQQTTNFEILESLGNRGSN